LTIALTYTITTIEATATGTYTNNIYSAGGTLLASAGGNWSLAVQKTT
jgi:hypothetical protein